MGVQILLLAGVLIFLWISLRAGAGSYRILRATGALVILTATVMSLLNPSLWQQFAVWLGVGRGTDLILYLLVPTFLVSIALSFVRIRQLERRLDQLVRQVAVQKAIDSLRAE